MPKIDVASLSERIGSNYPKPFDEPCARRGRKRLGDAAGLSDFGVNLLRLPPGTWSSQRHWHSHEDEFVYVLKGEVTLVSDAGEQILRAGDCCGFPKGSADGHKLVNASQEEVLCLEVGSREAADVCTYSDIDMVLERSGRGIVHKDGRPY